MTQPPLTKVVPSETVGYGPGRWVVRYYDPGTELWFDVGDPYDSRPEAEVQASPARVLMLQLGHDPVWDPPMTSAKRWTCSLCRTSGLDYHGTIYGAGVGSPCPTLASEHPEDKATKVRAPEEEPTR